MRFKRFIAIASIVVLLGLYLTTFIASLFTSEAAPGLFKASVLATFIVPVYMYVYLLILRYTKNKAQESKNEIDKALKDIQNDAGADDE